MTPMPGTTWRMLAERSAGKKLPTGLDAAWEAAAGILKRTVPRQTMYMSRAGSIIAFEKDLMGLTSPQLREECVRLRDIFRRGRETPHDVDRAFAAVREVAVREVGERPYPVQIAGALGLYNGCIVEMATGEGKTLTATLPATLLAWRGRGCHVITVNDYLARRDCEWMSRIFRFCGLTSAWIDGEMKPPDRRNAYHSDITYCTNKEVTADFLRDRLSLGRLRGLPSALLAKIVEGHGSGVDALVQRGLHAAIIDEADSVLIDEAVTPLIISGDAPNREQVEAFRQAVALGRELEPGKHFKVTPRYREVDLTKAGKDRLDELSEGLGGIWKGARRREEMVVQALTAREFYTRDKQYVVAEDKVVIVDEFTGRLMPDREWRDGLHQAVQAKEEITVQAPKDTYARISFQRFFRLYKSLSGMTGTAAEGWREFHQIYRLPVVVIPTNRPCVRAVSPDRVYATEDAKWRAVIDEVKRIHVTGRPILVGTRSVRASEHLSEMLVAEGLDHTVLNAVRHKEEAQIVAGAGQEGRITVATNMAGRGTDIKLGKGVADLGGLAVVATERHEAGRVDRQLFGRCSRQGDPGSAVAYVSLEDELVRRHAPRLSSMFRTRYHGSEREVSSASTRRLFNMAQHKAEKLALRQRKGVLKTDDWLDEYLGFAGSET